MYIKSVTPLLKLNHMFLSMQLITKLEDKCNALPSSHKKALSADPDDIMYTTPGDVGIYYDDDGQHVILTSKIVYTHTHTLTGHLGSPC